MDHDMDMDMDSGDSMPMMATYFNTDLPVTVAFQGWIIKDTGTLIGSCFGVAGLAIFFEILKTLRNILWLVYSKRSPYRKEFNSVSPSDGSVCSTSSDGHQPQYAYFWGMHFVHSLIYLIQIFLGYLLMLIVMVYNVWLVVSIIVGLSLGYFVAFFCAQALGIEDLENQKKTDMKHGSGVDSI